MEPAPPAPRTPGTGAAWCRRGAWSGRRQVQPRHRPGRPHPARRPVYAPLVSQELCRAAQARSARPTGPPGAQVPRALAHRTDGVPGCGLRWWADTPRRQAGEEARLHLPQTGRHGKDNPPAAEPQPAVRGDREGDRPLPGRGGGGAGAGARGGAGGVTRPAGGAGPEGEGRAQGG